MTGQRSALLVIDLQVDVVDGCHDADDVVARVAALARRARAEGAPVVWVQHSGPGVEHGTPGWRFAPGLAAVDGEPVVHKTHRDAFAGTELAQVLTGLGVNGVVVVGAQSDYCVRTTAVAAAARGYAVTLVADAHTTYGGTWDGVAMAAEQIIAHTNQYFRGLTYPAARSEVVRAADVAFA